VSGRCVCGALGFSPVISASSLHFILLALRSGRAAAPAQRTTARGIYGNKISIVEFIPKRFPRWFGTEFIFYCRRRCESLLLSDFM
jgi:hypothetical protein